MVEYFLETTMILEVSGSAQRYYYVLIISPTKLYINGIKQEATYCIFGGIVGDPPGFPRSDARFYLACAGVFDSDSDASKADSFVYYQYALFGVDMLTHLPFPQTGE